jgi:predicted O-methyltransferase YrrM
MSKRTLTLDDRLYDYLLSVGVREPRLFAHLRAETVERTELPQMQIAPEQGQFMALLAELLPIRRAIEIGTFTGYSALALASAMPEDGKLICCDVNRDWTAIARRYWEKAGVADRIELRLAPALETLDALIEERQAGSLDFAFLDAAKTEYGAYYEKCLVLLRPGGLIAVDNTLWGGSVADPDNRETDTLALRAFNEARHADERVSLSLLPIADGLTLLRKR